MTIVTLTHRSDSCKHAISKIFLPAQLIYRFPRFRRTGTERASFGNPLFVVLRARRACITQHRSVSRAPSLTMHVAATPSGLEPSGKNSNIFTVNWKRTDLSCAGAPMSHFSSLCRNRMGVFGKRVQVHWAWGQQCISMSLAFD